jgi:hypothetical protein
MEKTTEYLESLLIHPPVENDYSWRHRFPVSYNPKNYSVFNEPKNNSNVIVQGLFNIIIS